MVTDIPDEISLESGDIPADMMSTLLSAQEYIGYFHTGYYLLIVFAVLLAGGIVLVWRKVRPACLSIGIALAAAGVLELAGALFAGSYLPADIAPDMPAYLALPVNGFYLDVISVARLFSIALLAAGVVLLAVAVIYRPRTILD
jgi:hypothetical protein